MINMKCALLLTLFVVKINSEKLQIANPRLRFSPCLDATNIKIISEYDYGVLPLGEENQYNVTIPINESMRYLNKYEEIVIFMEFDNIAAVTVCDGTPNILQQITSPYYQSYILKNFIDDEIKLNVKGLSNGVIPYFKAVFIDSVNSCKKPVVSYLDTLLEDYRIARHVRASVTEDNCGQRKIHFNELMVRGESTKPGDWPWHVAIYKTKEANKFFICGGTLISKLFVLTAAHCVTINEVPVNPDALIVCLGKHNIRAGDKSSEEREILSVIVHEEFGLPKRMDNDIALLTLKTEAVYSDYVQPACIWSNDESQYISRNQLIGVVVGWGSYQANDTTLSSELLQASLPIVSNEECMRKNLLFYATMLRDGKKFCAGWGNGTLPCNGDSGGGFMVHLPRPSNDGPSQSTAAWYIRGVVSVAMRLPSTAMCDPQQYVVFTDVSIYEPWIRTKTKANLRSFISSKMKRSHT